MAGDRRSRRRCRAYPVDCLHVDLAGAQTAGGKPRLFVAIGRTGQCAFVELHERAGRMIAARFLRDPVAAVPCRIQTMLTEDGTRFTDHAHHEHACHHIFHRVCNENRIGHRLAKARRLWTDCQVERMNCTIEDGDGQLHRHYKHEQLRQHPGDFDRRLKLPKGITPYEAIR